MNHLFMVTSAINTRFGKFSVEERMFQTENTLKSVRTHAPGAKILLVESSGVPIDDDAIKMISANADYIVNLSGDPGLNRLYTSTDNWDIVKNLSELSAFKRALDLFKDSDQFQTIDRFYKLSGRYELNEFFNIQNFEQHPDKIILAGARESYIGDMGVKVTVPYMYPSRLWSWTRGHYDLVQNFYQTAIDDFRTQLEAGTYLDIEHMLYKHLPQDQIQELETVGVQGQVGYHAYFLKE